jgi:pheromone shutdown-related protein TraB
MISFKNITILGTSHIAVQSIREVESYIDKIKPDILALELDKARFLKLTSKTERKFSIKDLAAKGFFYNLLGAYLEKKLGERIGISPGAEMKKAIELSNKNNIKIALIDQDISITLRHLSSSITIKEKFRFILDILKIPLTKKKIKIDLTKVPNQKFINVMIKQTKIRYPNIYKVLVEERNIIMSKKLTALLKTDKKVLAIVGAGHEQELVRLIKWNLQKERKDI